MNLSWEIRGAGMKTIAESHAGGKRTKTPGETQAFAFYRMEKSPFLFGSASPMIFMKKSTTPLFPSNYNKNATNVGCIL